MAVGDRIKRVRNLRGMTQKELGLAVGYDENSADVRIAQYESGTRTPKEETLTKIAKILDVSYYSLYEPSLYAAEDVMFTLFELDEHYKIYLNEIVNPYTSELPRKQIGLSFNAKILNDFMSEWLMRKQELTEGVITREEYLEWKLNWPSTADDCGRRESPKKWRKDSAANENKDGE